MHSVEFGVRSVEREVQCVEFGEWSMECQVCWVEC